MLILEIMERFLFSPHSPEGNQRSHFHLISPSLPLCFCAFFYPSFHSFTPPWGNKFTKKNLGEDDALLDCALVSSSVQWEATKRMAAMMMGGATHGHRVIPQGGGSKILEVCVCYNFRVLQHFY